MIGDFETHGVVEMVVLLLVLVQPTQGTGGVKTVVGQKSKNYKKTYLIDYSD